VTQNTGEQSNTRGLVSPGSGVPFRPLHVLVSLFSYKHGKMSYIPCKGPFSRNLLPMRGSKGLFLEEKRKEKKGIVEGMRNNR
jgi:hypothetical protein